MDESRFIALALENPIHRAILDRLPLLALPDAWLVSGSLFQTVWNGLTGRAPGYGIR
ncbi:MAG TPA: nucleotidyltransferase family protein, partial [Parvibaculum sp.]